MFWDRDKEKDGWRICYVVSCTCAKILYKTTVYVQGLMSTQAVSWLLSDCDLCDSPWKETRRPEMYGRHMTRLSRSQAGWCDIATPLQRRHTPWAGRLPRWQRKMERGEEENQGLPSHLHHLVSCSQGNWRGRNGGSLKTRFDTLPWRKGLISQTSNWISRGLVWAE